MFLEKSKRRKMEFARRFTSLTSTTFKKMAILNARVCLYYVIMSNCLRKI